MIEEENENISHDSVLPLIDLQSLPSSSMSIFRYENSYKLSTNKKTLHKGNILVGLIRPYLKKCLISPINGITTGTIGQFKIKHKELRAFIVGIMTSNEFFNYLVNMSTGTKMPVVKANDILNFPFHWDPKIYKISKFNNYYFDMFINLNNENFNLAKLKKSLLEYLIK